MFFYPSREHCGRMLVFYHSEPYFRVRFCIISWWGEGGELNLTMSPLTSMTQMKKLIVRSFRFTHTHHAWILGFDCLLLSKWRKASANWNVKKKKKNSLQILTPLFISLDLKVSFACFECEYGFSHQFIRVLFGQHSFSFTYEKCRYGSFTLLKLQSTHY